MWEVSRKVRYVVSRLINRFLFEKQKSTVKFSVNKANLLFSRWCPKFLMWDCSNVVGHYQLWLHHLSKMNRYLTFTVIQLPESVRQLASCYIVFNCGDFVILCSNGSAIFTATVKYGQRASELYLFFCRKIYNEELIFTLFIPRIISSPL